MLNLNEKLFFLINNLAGQYTLLDGFFVFITRVFVPVIILLCTFWFFIVLPKKNKVLSKKFLFYKEGVLFIFSLVIVFLIVHLAKVIIAFPRPSEILSGVNSLSSYGSFDSFPSMHTALAFTVATFVRKYSKSTGFILFIIATLVGISRIFVGVHFPIDVLIGAFIGIVIPRLLFSVFKH